MKKGKVFLTAIRNDYENNFILSVDEIPCAEVNENCVATVRKVLQQKLLLIIPTAKFVSASRLGKQNSAKKAILVKMKSSADKENVKKACKAMKPNNFFANDDLSAEKQTILYVVRQAKKKFPSIVKGYSSTDGRLFAYIKNEDETENEASRRDRRVAVGNVQKLRAFCTDVLGCGLQTFIQTWPH